MCACGCVLVCPQVAFAALCLLRLALLSEEGCAVVRLPEPRTGLQRVITAAATLPPAAKCMLFAAAANMVQHAAGRAFLADDAGDRAVALVEAAAEGACACRCCASRRD